MINDHQVKVMRLQKQAMDLEIEMLSEQDRYTFNSMKERIVNIINEKKEIGRYVLIYLNADVVLNAVDEARAKANENRVKADEE